MTAYRPPIDDIEHALGVVGAGAVGDVPTMVELIGEFGRFCAEVVAPLNQPGDAAGVRFDPATGAVTTAPGWKDAYGKYVAAGWNAVSFPTAFGGGGFPWLVTVAMQEELNAASMAFALCPMLTQSGVHLLHKYGTEEQQARYLAPLTSGEWTGSMILTEANAGSDVGALVSRAEPVGDGTFRFTGQKIFITYGEHDLTDQTIHVVLGRLPDAPPGTKGISCFLVPKLLPDGTRNGVRAIGIEHKMGLHASPTCTLQFDQSVAELIGEPHGGMAAMFTMMNNARLSVGVEGLGVAVRAYQAAVDYARLRVQGQPVDRPAGAAIIEHPDVRRMLLHMRSHIEAMRLLAYRTALASDMGERELADLLTPLAKAWCTDTGAEVARLATQVVGGMGYIRETGVEQFERDVRVAAIYEGTNGIQAVDLVGRKVNGPSSAAADALIAEMGPMAAPLADATAWIRQAWSSPNRRDALAGATPYLHLFATTVAGWLMAKQASVAGSGPRATTASYFVNQVVPAAGGLLPAITAGASDIDALPADLF